MKYFQKIFLITLLYSLCIGITAKSLKSKKKSLPVTSKERCETQILPEPPCCGISSVVSEHIYGHHMVAPNELPWLVYIGLKLKPWYDSMKEDTNVHCGGTLINTRWVITAAHCTYYHTVEAVHLGEISCFKGKCGPNAIRIKVESTIIHRGFLYHDFEEDIALLRLAKPVNYSVSIKPICLLPRVVNEPNVIGRMGIVAGWSKSRKNASGINLLKTFDEIWNLDHCKHSFQDLALNDAYHICARGEKNISPCDGDSGGPLMLQSPFEKKYSGNKKGVYYQLGIVSFGVCGRRRSPIVYTNVTNYVPWIKETIMKK